MLSPRERAKCAEMSTASWPDMTRGPGRTATTQPQRRRASERRRSFMSLIPIRGRPGTREADPHPSVALTAPLPHDTCPPRLLSASPNKPRRPEEVKPPRRSRARHAARAAPGGPHRGSPPLVGRARRGRPRFGPAVFTCRSRDPLTAPASVRVPPRREATPGMTQVLASTGRPPSESRSESRWQVLGPRW